MRNVVTHWLKGLLAAFINGAASAVALIVLDPATFNFETGGRKLLTGSLVFGILAAANYLKQSPVPPDDDDNTIPPHKLAAALLVALLAGTGAGCATLAGLAPGAPASAQQAKLAELAKYVNAADQAITIAATVQDVEIAAHDNGRISKAKHDLIQQAFLEFATAAKQGLKLARDLSVPEATRFDAAKSVGALGLELLQRIEPHLPPEVAAYLTSFRSVMRLLGVSA